MVQSKGDNSIEIGLNAAVVTMLETGPAILNVAQTDGLVTLPYGQFDPSAHRTMEMGLRELVEAQTRLFPGYVEQLYTFGDRGRNRVVGDETPHIVSVGYLALARLSDEKVTGIDVNASWKNWYCFFPWEDWRAGRPAILDQHVMPALEQWACNPKTNRRAIRGLDPVARVNLFFGVETTWDDELVLERYELLYSAGLVEETIADGRTSELKIGIQLGSPMLHDHRRILATAIARLRSKLKYRPVIFELMQESFTLFDLQQTVESIFGRPVHKQNFRRLVEKANLVEPTGAYQHSTGGRPAALFRFRREILKERPSLGLRVGSA